MRSVGNWRLASGGTHTLAEAMTQACYREGVDLIENPRVEGVIVEDGWAVGVRTRTGDIRAEKCVASNADLHQTMLDLVGEEHLRDLQVWWSKDFRYGPNHVLATPIFCLSDASAYKSARHDPNIDRCFYTVVGLENAEEMAAFSRGAYMGRIPEPGLAPGRTVCDTAPRRPAGSTRRRTGASSPRRAT